MKKIIFGWLMVFVFAGITNAQVLTLNSTETLAVPTAAKLALDTVTIEVQNKTVKVDYRFLTATDITIIQPNGQSVRSWYCTDRDPQLAANCTGVGTPYKCCTGVGTGTNCDPGSTCFSDTFGFVIRTQDAGTSIGKGLRALIWSKMRPDVLTGANNATLP